MMIITFIRDGGLTGEDVDLRLDLNSLSIGESQQLLQLIEDADFFNLPGNLTPSGLAADEYNYVITIDADGGLRHTVHTSESSMPASLQPLIEELSRLSFAKPPEPK